MDILDLKEVESRAYGTRSENGVLDIVVGAGVAGYGLLAQVGAYLVPTYCLALALLLNRLVVVPRVGRVRFAANRRARERMGILLIALLILLPIPIGLAVFFADRLSSLTGFVATNLTIALGLLIALGMSVVAWAKSAGRFFVFAIMAVINFAGAQLFGQPLQWPMIATGAPVLAVGIILIARFATKNPVQRVEAA